MPNISIIDHTDGVESLLHPFRDALGEDLPAYRGHVYRVITYAMHFLEGNPIFRPLIETAFVYHDIGLWTSKALAYLEPSEDVALRDNERLRLGLDPGALRAVIHWHHKLTPYRGEHAMPVDAARRADWIDASGGMLRKGLTREQVRAVEIAIPNYNFGGVLQRLATDLGGSALAGNLRVLRHVFKP